MFESVKKATVALVHWHTESLEQDDRKPPYTIVGSGFCIHPRGMIVTCEHVLSAFMEKPVHQQIAETPEGDRGQEVRRMQEIRVVVPYVLFFNASASGEELIVVAAPADIVMAKTDYDLGMVRVHPHEAFPDGFPSLEVESYDQVQEGMEIATCGFPLGNLLGQQIGTMGSSFTKGIVSSIIPSSGVSEKYLKGFQLNLTATHGNSGGPVFSLRSGKVFGVLQRGVEGYEGQFLQGITKAEPIYPVLEHDSLARMLETPQGQIPSF